MPRQYSDAAGTTAGCPPSQSLSACAFGALSPSRDSPRLRNPLPPGWGGPPPGMLSPVGEKRAAPHGERAPPGVLYCLARRSCSGLAKACEQFKDLLGSRNSSSRDVQALKIACPSTENYRPSLVQAWSKPSNFLSKRDSLGRFRVGILSKPLPRAPSL